MAENETLGYTIRDEQDEHGGTIRHITAVDLSQDTVSADKLTVGTTAHNAQGEAIVGTNDESGQIIETASIEAELEGYGEIDAELEGYGEIEGEIEAAGITVTPYILPPATKSKLGGVIVGDDLLVTEDGVISVDKATSAEEDNTRPITAAAVYTEIGNINALLATI